MVISALMRISRTGSNGSVKWAVIGLPEVFVIKLTSGTVVHKQGWESRIFPAKNCNEHENELKKKLILLNVLHHARQFS